MATIAAHLPFGELDRVADPLQQQQADLEGDDPLARAWPIYLPVKSGIDEISYGCFLSLYLHGSVNRRNRGGERPGQAAARRAALAGVNDPGRGPAGCRCGAATTPAVVREELATLAAHGINLNRSFCHWPDFHPEPDRLDEAVLARFADLLDGHREAGLGTVPTFIVAHMSGQNWDLARRHGR